MRDNTKANPPRTAVLGLSLLLLATTQLAADGGGETGAAPDTASQFKGTVRQVHKVEKTVSVKNFWGTRTFALADDCRITLEESSGGALKDLEPGHRVTVDYVRHDGVRIAREIKQENLEYTGHIAALDPTNRTLRVKSRVLDRVFSAGPDCPVIFRDGRSHDFAELKLGHRVTVTYLTPDKAHLARRINQGSLEFSGKVEALDAGTDTVKAGGLASSRTFRLGDGCQIVVAGQPGGELKNLRIGDRVLFHYEDVDGVLVANRLELVAGSEEPAVEQMTSRKSRSP